MRKAFISALCDEAKADKRILLITGDLGYQFLEPFAHAFPDQFLNIGVAESNMVNVAAGLASVGYKPFIYSIATFASMRAFEQIRTVVALQHLNVKIVGIGAGLSYAKHGPTHHSLEDIGIMRMIPTLTILNPVDPFECYSATRTLVFHKGPAYLRLERNPSIDWYQSPPKFTIGKANIIQKATGKEKGRIAILVTGTKIPFAQEVSRLLSKKHLPTTVVSFPTVTPLDTALLKRLFRSYSYVVTIEEHMLVGGFGTAVGEEMLKNTYRAKLLKFGLAKEYTVVNGDYNELVAQYSFTPQHIAKKILSYGIH